jgi:hypothetical protein
MFLMSYYLVNPNQVPVQYEKGIEMIKGRGYVLEGDADWLEVTEGNHKIMSLDLDDFLELCQRINADEGRLTVYADRDERVLFVLETTLEPNTMNVYYCSFQ